MQKMPTDAFALVLVLFMWLQWHCTQDRQAILAGGVREITKWSRELCPALHGEAEVNRAGLIVLQWGAAPSERVEQQLRGRSGRQGDPGATYAVISLKDPSLSYLLPEFQQQAQILSEAGLDVAHRPENVQVWLQNTACGSHLACHVSHRCFVRQELAGCIGGATNTCRVSLQ